MVIKIIGLLKVQVCLLASIYYNHTLHVINQNNEFLIIPYSAVFDF